MKFKICFIGLLISCLVSYGQIDPVDLGPTPDTPRGALLKVNSNIAYLDTMGVQRLDSLISGGLPFLRPSGTNTLTDDMTINHGNNDLLFNLGNSGTFSLTNDSGTLLILPNTFTHTHLSGAPYFTFTANDAAFLFLNKITVQPQDGSAALRLFPLTTDPSELTNGDIWINDTDNSLKIRIDGSTQSIGGNGTVTSVGMTVPTGLSISGAPVTTSGTLAVTYTSGYQGYTSAESSLVASAVQDLSDLSITATAAELNALDGITSTVTELNYTNGVTSPIQMQLNGKQGLDSDLTSIAGLSASNDDFLQRKSGVWANRTLAQVRTDLALVSASITNGVTASAPNQDQVFDALALTSTQINTKLPAASTASTGTAVAFDIPRTYGYAADATGNITLNTTGLVEGITQLMIHNDSSEPTFASGYVIISGEYMINVDNYIMFHAVKSNLVLVTISQEQ